MLFKYRLNQQWRRSWEQMRMVITLSDQSTTTTIPTSTSPSALREYSSLTQFKWDNLNWSLKFKCHLCECTWILLVVKYAKPSSLLYYCPYINLHSFNLILLWIWPNTINVIPQSHESVYNLVLITFQSISLEPMP